MPRPPQVLPRPISATPSSGPVPPSPLFTPPIPSIAPPHFRDATPSSGLVPPPLLFAPPIIESFPAPSQRCPALSALYPERCPAHPQPRKPVNSRLALQSFFTGEGKKTEKSSINLGKQKAPHQERVVTITWVASQPLTPTPRQAKSP